MARQAAALRKEQLPWRGEGLRALPPNYSHTQPSLKTCLQIGVRGRVCETFRLLSSNTKRRNGGTSEA